MWNRRQILALLAAAAPGATRTEVIAHRGEHLENPENTIPAIERAIAYGVDWVELDVRTTKDGAFVLMHDGTVDRTTNGKGNVADLTLAEIRALDSHGAKVPTLDEALETLRGKCGIYFDAKRIAAESIVSSLRKHSMLDRAVVYGGFQLMQQLGALGHPELAMPEASSIEITQRILAELKPRVVAFDRRDFKPEIVALVRGAGKQIFVDRLGPDDTAERWREAVQMGASGIQTDHPRELIQLLRPVAA